MFTVFNVNSIVWAQMIDDDGYVYLRVKLEGSKEPISIRPDDELYRYYHKEITRIKDALLAQ